MKINAEMPWLSSLESLKLSRNLIDPWRAQYFWNIFGISGWRLLIVRWNGTEKTVQRLPRFLVGIHTNTKRELFTVDDGAVSSIPAEASKCLRYILQQWNPGTLSWSMLDFTDEKSYSYLLSRFKWILSILFVASLDYKIIRPFWLWS